MPLTIETLADAVERGVSDTMRSHGIHREVRREVHGHTCVLWLPGSDGHALCAWCGQILDAPTMPGPDAGPGLECRLTCPNHTAELRSLLEAAVRVMKQKKRPGAQRLEVSP